MLRAKALRAGLTIALFGLASFGTAADPKEEAVKKDLMALEGTWEVKSMLRDGKEVKVPDGSRLTLTGTKYVIKAGSTNIETGTFTIDPTRSPKQLDVTPADGPDKGKQVPGIYELKGDGMTAAGVDPGKERPVDFSGKVGVVITYKRVKP